ncbi:50S ribosomal protein L31e [Candidatus Bathycorpusculum sp.]|jgi:large subunit ribosomal protein L31e|uniref:50S ribosomal protein L31e n=1 Tax=Candidatus Bathycorpusculum sp. TaxID=2994959 RepID=UPI0031CC5949
MVNAQEEQQIMQQENEEILEAPEETISTQKEIMATADTTIEEPKTVEKQKKKTKTDDIVTERIYTIPLQKALVRPPKKRAPRAVQLVKIFVAKHMKMATTIVEEDDELPQLIVTQEVNEKIWNRGIEKPPRKIRVRVTKDRDDNVTVYLAEAE